MNTMEHASTTMGPTYATVQMVGKGNTAPMVDLFDKTFKRSEQFLSCAYDQFVRFIL